MSRISTSECDRRAARARRQAAQAWSGLNRISEEEIQLVEACAREWKRRAEYAATHGGYWTHEYPSMAEVEEGA
jgi:hypothetical protein